MRTDAMAHAGRLRAAGTILLLVAALGGCGLEEVEVPDLDGPSTYGTGVRMTATPDIILADGLSTSLITATVWDQNGRPAAGRQVFFQVSHSSGFTADIGKLRSTGPDQDLGTGLLVRTDSNGVARVVYVAPPRTDFTNNGTVLVTARPVGEDASGAVIHSVRIELRSAEPRFFPNAGGNLFCSFVVEAPTGRCTSANNCAVRVNSSVIFQNASQGDIIRYQWFFGDGTAVEYGPDQVHVFRIPGTYLVTLLIVDSVGNGAACATPLTVIP